MKQIRLGADSANAMALGIRQFVGSIATTLGPAGRTVFIQSLTGPPLITKDGVTVAKQIFLPDPAQDMIVQTLKQVATNLGDEHGDGTTTSSVIASIAALKGLAKKTSLGNELNAYAYGNGMRQAAKDVCEAMKPYVVQLPEKDEERFEIIRRIAHISSNGDHMVSDTVRRAYEIAGQSGTVTIHDSLTDETYVTTTSGYEFNTSIPDSSYTGVHQVTAPLVWVVGDPLIYGKQVIPLLKKVAESSALKNRPLVLFCPRIEGEALAAMLVNRQQFLWLPIIVQGGIYPMEETFKDICACTGATFVSDSAGRLAENSDLDVLGGFDGTINVSGQKTTLTGYNKNNLSFIDRLTLLEAIIDTSTENKEKQNLVRLIIKKLTAPTASIYVGSSTTVSRNELKDRFDDAVCAVRTTINGGYMVGGGNVPAEIAYEFLRPFMADDSIDSFKLGYRDMLEAIIYPYYRIRLNGGMFCGDIDDTNGNTNGYADCLKHIGRNKHESLWNCFVDGKFMDIDRISHSRRQDQVIDPANVVEACITVAANMAATIVTTECTVSFIAARNQD